MVSAEFNCVKFQANSSEALACGFPLAITTLCVIGFLGVKSPNYQLSRAVLLASRVGLRGNYTFIVLPFVSPEI